MLFCALQSVSGTLSTSLELRFTGVPELSVIIYVVKNASRPRTGDCSPAQDGKRFRISVCRIVTLRAGLCKSILRGVQLKVCGAINKEIGC